MSSAALSSRAVDLASSRSNLDAPSCHMGEIYKCNSENSVAGSYSHSCGWGLETYPTI